MQLEATGKPIKYRLKTGKEVPPLLRLGEKSDRFLDLVFCRSINRPCIESQLYFYNGGIRGEALGDDKVRLPPGRNQIKSLTLHVICGGVPCVYHPLLPSCSVPHSVSHPFLILCGRKECLRLVKVCRRLRRGLSQPHRRLSKEPQGNSRPTRARPRMMSKPWTWAKPNRTLAR